VLETVKDHPLVPAIILASIIGVFLLRYLNRRPATPKKPRQPRPKRKKRR
jgi:hypothetical protein